MRRAFLDPTTARLKAHGFVQSNEPGDVILDISEEFNLNPQDGWKWDGTKFVTFPFPLPPDHKAKAKIAISQVPAGPQRAALDALLEII